MAQAQKAFEWRSVSLETTQMREAIVALKNANISDDNDLIYKDIYFLELGSHVLSLRDHTQKTLAEISKLLFADAQMRGLSDDFYQAILKEAAYFATGGGKIKHAHIMSGIVTTEKILGETKRVTFKNIEGEKGIKRAVFTP